MRILLSDVTTFTPRMRHVCARLEFADLPHGGPENLARKAQMSYTEVVSQARPDYPCAKVDTGEMDRQNCILVNVALLWDVARQPVSPRLSTQPTQSGDCDSRSRDMPNNSFRKKYRHLIAPLIEKEGSCRCHYCKVRLDPDVKRLSMTIVDGYWHGFDSNGHLVDFLQIDHVIPRAKGGTDDLSNLVLCCPTCNSRKRDLPYEAFIRCIKPVPENEIWS